MEKDDGLTEIMFLSIYKSFLGKAEKGKKIFPFSTFSVNLRKEEWKKDGKHCVNLKVFFLPLKNICFFWCV